MTNRREAMLRPFEKDHSGSVSRRAASRAQKPSSLHKLIRWFVAGWQDEMPDTLHRRGVEWDKPGKIVRPRDGTVVDDPGGGSRLGTPRWSQAFASRITGSAFFTENPSSDGQPEISKSYATPMRAVVAHLETSRHPLKAQWLRLLANAGGDVGAVSAWAKVPDEYGESITRDALSLAWDYYLEVPSGDRVA